MIALTKEKREELIVCANEIKKMATSTHGYKVGNDAFGSNALMLMDVAIASLTAVPINPADCFEPVYLSPPAPEIKLPSINRYEKYLGTLAEEAWRDCIVEVKRLNGLVE